MSDHSHLNAINARLDRETERLDKAQTDQERTFRQRQIDAALKERDAELTFLGITPISPEIAAFSDTELLAQLEQ